MKCHHVSKLLPLYAGNDLGRFRSAAVRRHLTACQPCRRELKELEAARCIAADAVRTRAASVRDIELWQDVVCALPRREGTLESVPIHKKGTPQSLAPLLIGAAAVVIALLFHEGRRAQPSTRPEIAELPVVESVDEPGVTVMTFQTDDPKVTIVWLFKDETNL